MSVPRMCGDCEMQGRTGTGPHGETSGAEHCSCWYDGRADGYREGREGAFREAKQDCRASHTVEVQRINALQQHAEALESNLAAVVDALECEAHPTPEREFIAQIVSDIHLGLHRAEFDYRATLTSLNRVEAALERVRAIWPHIEIAAGPRSYDKSRVSDPGAPTCLRCKIEEAIGAAPEQEGGAR